MVTPMFKLCRTNGSGSLLSKVFRWTIRPLFRHKVYLFGFIVILTIASQLWEGRMNIFDIQQLDYIISPSCRETNNLILINTSEIDKVSSAAATTLMSLLPALLVFGPFPTAQIRAMIPYSTAAALLTSGFTLGLATPNISTIGKNRILRVIDLCTEATIRLYG